MKQSILFSLFVFLCLFSSAQFEKFDLSKYNLPDIKRHQLDLTFDHDNSYTNSRKDDIENSNLSFDDAFEVKYSYYLNTRQKQKQYYVSLLSDFLLDKNKTIGAESERIYNSDLNFNTFFDNRYYINGKKQFINLQPDIDFWLLHDGKKDFEIPSETKSRNLSIRPHLYLGYGYGRIEPVGDIRHAIYILEEFVKSGRLDKMPNEEEVVEIGNRISELKNQRFFDSRLRKIYEIKSIDSLLVEMGIIENQDATYFTGLNDVWDYGQEDRESGTRFQLDLQGGINYYLWKDIINENSSEEIKKTKLRHDSYGLRFQFDHYKPIGLKWQKYFTVYSAFLRRVRQDINSSEEEPSTKENAFYIHSAYGYDWFPNTRTKASFSLKTSYSENNYLKGDRNDRSVFTIGFGGSIYYYISPKLNVELKSVVQYLSGEQSFIGADWQFNFSNQMALNYAIF